MLLGLQGTQYEPQIIIILLEIFHKTKDGKVQKVTITIIIIIIVIIILIICQKVNRSSP